MPARDVHDQDCGHASCAARKRGMQAQGRAALEFFRENRISMATYLDWDELSPDEQQPWIDLVNHAVDAFWDAWVAD